jgi:GT2 family glycosyltransferase
MIVAPMSNGRIARATVSSPPVHVAIVAFGPPDTLSNCLEGLGGVYPCIVVDNASNARTHDVCRRFGVNYIDPGTNAGFAAGANRAFAELPLPDCDVLLVNPDAIVQPPVVDRLHELLHGAPELACVAPAQHGPGSDHLDPVYRPFPTPLGASIDAIGLGRLRRREFVVGSILLLNGAALVDVGGFDERFFLYAEETDWQLRAKQRGWAIRYCPEVLAEHTKGGTDSDWQRRELRWHAGTERYVRKWYGDFGWRIYSLATACGSLARAAVLTGERRRVAARWARLLLRGPEQAAQRAGVLAPPRAHIPTLPPSHADDIRSE